MQTPADHRSTSFDGSNAEDSGAGTRLNPRYVDGPALPDFNVNGDLCLHERLYTYRANDRLVAGWVMNVMFTIDRSPDKVWPYLKDFNLWQPNHYYSGVLGDMEGQISTSSHKPGDFDTPYRREVIKVVPEHLLITAGLVPEDPAGWPGMPGIGGISPSFTVFTLSGHGGKTVVTVFMQLSAYASKDPNTTVEEALAPWAADDYAPELQRKWREDFIPKLKKLIYENVPE